MENNYEWDLFENISTRAAAMTASIYKGGKLALTKAVKDSIDSEYIELLYSKKQNKIGIRASVEESPNALQLRQPKRQSSWIVTVAAFIKYYQLSNIESKKYPVTQDGNIFIVDLNKGI